MEKCRFNEDENCKILDCLTRSITAINSHATHALTQELVRADHRIQSVEDGKTEEVLHDIGLNILVKVHDCAFVKSQGLDELGQRCKVPEWVVKELK